MTTQESESQVPHIEKAARLSLVVRDLGERLKRLAAFVPPEDRAAWLMHSSNLLEASHFVRSKLPGTRGGTALPWTLAQREKFGQLLKDKRNGAHLTQRELASLAKISDQTIKQAEAGKKSPTRATLTRLIAVPRLGLSWDDVPGEASEAASVPDKPTPPDQEVYSISSEPIAPKTCAVPIESSQPSVLAIHIHVHVAGSPRVEVAGPAVR